MKVYLVGGAVRDRIMGIEPHDRDYVVVGSTPKEMIELGFKQVGKDFPVFLHPATRDEYALARTERKVAPGHTGFTCEWEGVTLEEDLTRRDLTINAIAMDLETGGLIDPLNGQQDIKDKVLRACSDAFTEDPLRILRTLRFAAKTGFYISAKTTDAMKEMAPELPSVTPERVWNEMEKALSTPRPDVFFKLLGMLTPLFPMWDEMDVTPQREDHHPEVWVSHHTLLVMQEAVDFDDPLVVFAALCHDFGKPHCYREYGTAHGHEEEGLRFITSFCDQYRVPSKYKSLALLVCKFHTKVHGCMGRGDQGWVRPKSIMALFEQTKAEVKHERFYQLLQACEADAKGRGAHGSSRTHYHNLEYPQRAYLKECLRAVERVDSGKIVQAGLERGARGSQLGELVRVAKIDAIREVQNKWKNQK